MLKWGSADTYELLLLASLERGPILQMGDTVHCGPGRSHSEQPEETLKLLPMQDAAQASDCLITQRGYTSGQSVISGTLDSQSIWWGGMSRPNNYSHLSLGMGIGSIWVL